ncbi:MAG: efflux RND transporter periplasmic adaptor subunit [Candidatus Omnitrophica bacterium]|nr:efflux RND transporter periplasmic adaptor subunit [Candidatus Omnitrophota bacterium]
MKISAKTFWLILFIVILTLSVAKGKDIIARFLGPSGLKMTSHSGEHKHGKDIYYCPMHPTYTSDRPGDCPICNMKLVKKTLPAPSSGTALKSDLSPLEGDSSPLKTVTVKELMNMKPGEICLLHKCKMGKCMFVMTEEAARLGKCPHCGEDLGVVIKDLAPAGYGGLTLSPEKQQMIGIQTSPAEKKHLTKTIRTAGKIAYDPALYQAQEEYLQGIQAYEKAKTGNIPEIAEQASKLVDSSKVKLRLLGFSEDLLADLEKSGKPDRSLLYSEAGGTVWLYAPIYEYEIPLVKIGDKVQVEIPALPGKKVEGVIRSMDPVVDPMTRSVRVRAVLENQEGVFKPEMYVNASLNIDLGSVLVIPSEAVFSTGEKNIVFVAKPDGVFEPREVVLGTKTESGYEIKNGVGEGESVVTSGNFLIDSESRLKAALEGVGGTEGSVHQHG